MVKRTRDKETDLGSRAVPMATVLAHIPILAAATSRRPPMSGEAVRVERLLDIQRRNLAAYDEAIAKVGSLAPDDPLLQQAEKTRTAVEELKARLDELTPPAPAVESPITRQAGATLPPRGEFVGRADELNKLKDALGSDRWPVVAIEGMGGVGKTALALEAAHDWSSAGFEGVVWVSAVQRPLALADLVDTTARVLDYPAVTRLPDEKKGDELRRVLAQHRYLVVLDGFEAVDDASIDSFVRSLPEPSKTLLTSRRSVVDVRTIPLRGLSAEEAIELLQREADRIGVTGIDEVASDLTTLYTLTGGSPLALKWALGLLRQGYDLGDVIESLQAAEGEVFDVIMGRTWDRLSAPARSLLLAMHCFVAPATKARMKAAAGLPEADFDAAVEELTSGSLLEQQGTLSRRAFAVPPLLRAFAGKQVRRDDEQAARLRLADDFLALVNECKSGYGEGFDRIEAELVNVLDTVDWCVAHEQWQPVVDLVDGLAEFLWIRGYWSERIKRATQGLDAARHVGDDLAAGRFAYFIGWVHSRWHHQDEALRWADNAEKAMSATFGDANPYALELRGLATFRATRGSPPTTPEETAAFQEAEAVLRRAKDLFAADSRVPNGDYLATTVKDNLGELYRDWGRDDDARACFEEVLSDAQAHGWEERLATANGDLGDLALKASDLGRARELYETGLAYAIRIKRANTIALCRLGLGRTLRQRGEGKLAYDHLREALEIYRRLNATATVDEIEAELRTLAAELTPEGRPDEGPS